MSVVRKLFWVLGLVLVVVGLVQVGVARADSSLVVRESGVLSGGLREVSERAISSGGEVEVEFLAGPDQKVVALPGGGFRWESAAAAFRGRGVDGVWGGVDLRLAEAGGRFRPRVAVVEQSMSGGGGDVSLLKVGFGEDVFEFVWPGGVLPVPVVEGDFARYEDVLPGVDVVVRSKLSGGSVNFVVKDRAAARRVVDGGLEFGWRAGPGLGLVKRDGLLQVVRGEEIVHRFDSLVMWDSRSNENGGLLGLFDSAAEGGLRVIDAEVVGDRLRLVPDKDFLMGSDTVFPVVVDPSVSSGMTWHSTTVGSLGLVKHDEGWVGYQGWQQPFAVYRTYHQMKLLGALHGAQIRSAVLTASSRHSPTWNNNTDGNGCVSFGSGVELTGTSAWHRGISWGNQPSWGANWGQTALTAPHSKNGKTCKVSWNITGLVQQQANANEAFMTVVLRSANEGDPNGWRRYHLGTDGWWPRIAVEFNFPVGGLSDPGLDSGNMIKHGGVYYTAGDSAVLWGRVHDRDGGNVRLVARRWNGSGWVDTGVWGDFKSGDVGTLRVPLSVSRDANGHIVGDNTVRLFASDGMSEAMAPVEYRIITDSRPPAVPGLGQVAPGLVDGRAGFVGQRYSSVFSIDDRTWQVRWGLDTGPSTVVDKASGNATSQVSWTMVNAGPHVLQAQAVSKAGVLSPLAKWPLSVRQDFQETNRWLLDGDVKPRTGGVDFVGQGQYEKGSRLLPVHNKAFVSGSGVLKAPGVVTASGSVSYGMWVRPDQDCADTCVIAATRNSDGVVQTVIAIVKDDKGFQRFALGVNQTGAKDGALVWRVNTERLALKWIWNYVAVTVGQTDKDSKTVNLFVRGGMKDVTTSVPGAFTGQADLVIGGADLPGMAGSKFVGRVDDVRIGRGMIDAKTAHNWCYENPYRTLSDVLEEDKDNPCDCQEDQQ